MGVSTVDGTIVSADFKRKAAKVRIYRSIVFRLANGETKTVLKPIVHPDVAEHLAPGTSGRFYLFTAIDHRGLHGVRVGDGKAAHAHPKNNEVIGLVLTLIGIAWAATTLAIFGDIAIFALIVLILGPIVWITNRNLRIAGERQFAADNGYAPPVAPPAAEPASA